MTSTAGSSPIENGHPSSQNSSDAEHLLEIMEAIALVPYDVFSANYLPVGLECPEVGSSWTLEQQELIDEIRNMGKGNKTKLYTESAPLLRLLFYSHHNESLSHPFLGASLAPDIMILRENPKVLENPLGLPLEPPGDQNWSTVAAIGEAKGTKNSIYQTASYLRNHLQHRPDLHSVLGFSAKASGYSLFYHDASVIHQSPTFDWTAGPLHAFVRQLYQGTPFDPSMVNLRPTDPRPSWGIRIDSDIFVTITAKTDPGLGQRRFTAVAKHVATKELWFIKDFYRDDRRRFFEGVLYDKAHKGTALPGLMHADHYGYLLDTDGKVIKTSNCGLGSHNRAPIERSKMRVATRDVGQALGEAKTLSEFLHTMYDACVVQRNLYRKCKILHRDISNNNVMIAPKHEHFLERCAHGYNEVKYLNQILVPTEPPKPACLLIDLGNGADLGAESEDSGVLAERTGTPKFISRAISQGELLPNFSHGSVGVSMPTLSGRSLELYTSVNSDYEAHNRAVDQDPPTLTDSDVTEFTHQLFHDAESTFWVIGWFLARRAPQGYKVETEWDPKFKRFVTGMESHYPSTEQIDPRLAFFPRDWATILHPDLSSMASMMSGMHRYIFPEWSYRSELDPEHVHEVIMRLLFSEILRIRDENADVVFHAGIRALPTKSKATSSLSNSQTTASFLSVPASSKKRSRSHDDDDTGSISNPRRSPRLAQLELHGTRDADQVKAADEELLREAQNYPWVQMPKYLECPNGGPPDNSGIMVKTKPDT